MPTHKIVVVGLGPGNPDQLTLAAYKAIENARQVYLRTAKHPTVPHLPNQERLQAFDDFYDRYGTFEEVYGAIVVRLLDLAQHDNVIYAVPGHPLVGESSVLRLIEAAKAANVAVEIIDGLSFLEPTCSLLALDPLAAGLLILDATELASQAEIYLPRSQGLELPVTRSILIGQVYNQRLASAVKLALMENFADEHPVTLIRGAGIEGEAKRLDIKLYELDRHPEWTDHLTSVYVPARPIVDALGTFANAQYIVATLHAPDGCAWDRKQTHSSLKRHLLEETYEVLHALDQEPDKLAEELGDLLLQILLHAQIAAEDENEGWTIADVMREMSDKMIKRHPHIFLDRSLPIPEWETVKQLQQGDGNSSVLAGVPNDMPALLQAQTLQRKAASKGFEWRNYEQILDKLVEELTELRNATSPANLVEEFGDVLAMMTNAARWLKVDAEEALRLVNIKFKRRFTEWEHIVDERGLDPHAMDLPQLQALWIEARQRSGEVVNK